jgi:DNA-binding response OmpR family regulator
MPRPGQLSPHPCAAALFNSSDDTVEMVRRMLSAVGIHCLAGCHFSDLKNGNIDLAAFLNKHDPQVVIFDISPPYAENWEFFKTLQSVNGMDSRGLVLTTTNKDRLDEVVGGDSQAIQIVGKPYDLQQITTAITAAVRTAVATSRTPLKVSGKLKSDSNVDSTELGTVAIFEASADTVAMMQALLTEIGASQSLISCPFADLRRGITDFRKYLDQHNPEVVIVDISVPYDENWAFFVTIRDAAVMQGRGVVLTTTSKIELDELIGEDSHAFEVVGAVTDHKLLLEEIKAATRLARTARRQASDGAPGPPPISG